MYAPLENSNNFIRRASTNFGIWVRLAVTGAILAYLALKVDWAGLLGHLRNVSLPYFGLAFFVMGLPIVLTSLRWQLLLRVQEVLIPIRRAISFDVVGLFFNAFLPGSTGGDAARVYYAIKSAPNHKTGIVVSILMDRGIGLSVLLAYGTLALAVQPEMDERSELLSAVKILLPIALVAGLSAVVIVAVYPTQKIPQFLKDWMRKLRLFRVIKNAVTSVRNHRHAPMLVLAAIGISAISYLCNFFSGFILVKALNVDLSLLQVVVILAITYTLISVPISLSGHGVRELTLILLFGAMGVGETEVKELAIAYSVLLYGIQLCWSLLGGIYYISWRPEHHLR